MRKKLFLSLMVILAVVLSGFYVNAETGTGEKVEISFKVGDEILKINDKDVKVEKPYVINGVTLVPLRVITEAFGSEVTWNGTDRSIVLKYNDVLIKLVIGSKEAIVDSKKTALLEAPVIKGGVTMVPMRFITENFGADVSYDDKTKAITVLKEIANSNSIKDFGLLLKKTNKSKVGDSFYNWSISLPKKLNISYRNFNGTVNNFAADDETYSLSLYIETLEDETLDSILSDEIDDAKDYTILDQGIKSTNGQNYVKCLVKGEKFAYESRIFINSGKIYTVYLHVPDYNTYKNNKDLTNLLDSFNLKFADDGTSEDLSDINIEGYRKYEDKKLKWSIAVQPDMGEYKSNNKENVVSFLDEDENLVMVSMYSIEDGLTLDKWVENDLKDVKEKYNPELFKVVSTEESSLNGVRCKKMISNMTLNGKTRYSVDYYIFGKDYRFEVAYLIKSEAYNNVEVKKKFDAMLSSFKFSDADKDEVGQLTDPDKIVMSDNTRKVENKNYKWSFEIPVSWTSEDDNDGTSSMYISKDKSICVSINVAKGASLDAYASGFEQRILDQSAATNSMSIDKKEDITDKGVVMKKYLIINRLEDSVAKQIAYIFAKNGNIYFIVLGIDEMNWCDKNIKLIDTIWQSAKFE